MYNITVIVNENNPAQLSVFLKTFKQVNQSDKINYKFIVTSTKFITQYDGCQHEILTPYKNDHRLGFISKVDQILAAKPDLVVIASDMIMCRKSMVDWFTSLIEYTDSGWELCGSALMPPQFPLVLCQEEDFAPVTPDCYITIAAGFCILNPKTVQADNAEYALQLIGDDKYDLVDELVLNVRYSKKIVNQLICCPSDAFLTDFDKVKNALINLYYNDPVAPDSWYFLNEYYNYADDALKHDIKPHFVKLKNRKLIIDRMKEKLMNQHIAVSFFESGSSKVNFTKYEV